MLIGSAVFLALTVYLYKVIPQGFIPRQDTGVFFGSVVAPEGTTFPELERRMHQVREIIQKHPDVDAVLATRLARDAETFTGALLGENCRGSEKLRRLDAWLATRDGVDGGQDGVRIAGGRGGGDGGVDPGANAGQRLQGGAVGIDPGKQRHALGGRVELGEDGLDLPGGDGGDLPRIGTGDGVAGTGRGHRPVRR